MRAVTAIAALILAMACASVADARAPKDVAAPRLADVDVASVDDSGVVMTWRSDEPTRGCVIYVEGARVDSVCRA